MTKPTGDKSPALSPHSPVKLNARNLLALLSDGQPQSWKSIIAALVIKAPHEIKHARQLLKGLIRQGEITELDGRHYALAKSIATKQRSHEAAAPQLPENESLDAYGQGKACDEAQDELQGGVKGYGGKLTVDGLPIVRSQDRRRDIPNARLGDTVVYRRVQDNSGQAAALVLSISQHSSLPVVGILKQRGRHPHVEPIARSFEGRIALPEGTGSAVQGDAVRVEIIDHDRFGPVGRILDVMPNASVVSQAIEATLESLSIPRHWPEAVPKAAQRLPKTVDPKQHQDRHDITDLPLVTIDGATAKDFDDAVFAQALGGQKGWRLVVAIADVANYVKPRSALDAEAAQRSTSVYLPGHVVPMLPEAISNELCSLKPNVHRLALVCDMQVSRKGIVRAYSFYNALIRSHGRLTYEEVQAHIDHQAVLPCQDEDRAAVNKSVGALTEVHEALRYAKDERGGLHFDSREGVIDIEQGHVTGVLQVARLQAHQIIEEAMINANVCAAAFIEANDSRSLYRLHEAPDVLKLETLRADLMAVGLKLPDGVPNSKTYQTLLREIANKTQGWLYQQLVLRSMKQAVYGPNNVGHFGLGLERYMHFTSPIRRYPDLLVHRAIKSILQGKTNRGGWVPSIEQLGDLGEHCSTNERRAESAGWTVEAWLKCDLVKQHLGEQLPGTIAGVTEFGLFVDLDGFFVQGLLHISDLGHDYFRYDSRKQSLTGDRSGKRFTLGEPLLVTVANVEPPQGKIELQLVISQKKPGRQKSAVSTKNAQTKKAPSDTRGKELSKNDTTATKKKQTTPNAIKRRKRKTDG